MPTQVNWRFRQLCNAMFYDGLPSKFVCADAGPPLAPERGFQTPLGLLANIVVPQIGEIWTARVAIDPVSTTSPTAPPRSGILSSSRIENASLPSMKAVMSVSRSRSSRA